MGEESLLDVGNFIILLVSGAIIPLLLVLYKYNYLFKCNQR